LAGPSQLELSLQRSSDDGNAALPDRRDLAG
jgi:hypothetical protein